MLHKQNGKTIVKILLCILVVSIIAGYSTYQARNIIKGPQIEIRGPTNGSTVSSPLVKVEGIARNISYISLNNRQIFVDKEGQFSEELLLYQGYNSWKIEAKDKFGRTISKNIELVLR